MRTSLVTVCLVGVMLQQVASHHDAEHTRGGEVPQQENDAKFLLSVATVTRTRIRISTSVSTSFFSCINDLSTTVSCARRRRRRSSLQSAPLPEITEDQPLMSSQVDINGAGEPSERLLLNGVTVYTTVFSTATVTSTSVDHNTTVKIAFSCTTSGMAVPPLC